MSRFLIDRLKSLEPYVPGEQPRDEVYIKLNTNESPFPPAPGIKELITAEEIDKLRLYSDPEARGLAAAAAKFYGIAEENVFCGNGSDEIIAFAMLALCGKGIAVPDVTYGFYKSAAALFGIEMREVPLDEDFNIRVGDYKGLPETLFIANPNAQTGAYLPLSEIETLLGQDKERLVVVDEAYIDFGGESAVALIGKYDNLLVIQTLSKSRSLAGKRIGAAFAVPEIIGDLKAARFSFNPYANDRFDILCGAEAFRNRAYFDNCRSTVIETRSFTERELLALGFRVIPSKANFLLAGREGVPGETLYLRLKDKGILVRHLSVPRLEGYIRVSIGARSDMEKFITAIKEIIK